MKSANKKIKLSGVGIHSGLPVNIVVKPSDKSGIYFKRTDIKGSDLIPAKYDNVSDTLMRNTTIGDKSNAYVQTVEHLMAALFVSGVNGAVVEIDGPETPILDGSAYEFINAFAGIATNQSKIKKIIVKKPIIAYRNELVKTMPFWKRLKTTILNHTIWRRGNGYVKLSPNDTGLLIDATLV
ncbi:MAG: UDP-3-O-acyl-N-acetylglucosamine deacetylase, partial [Alphaproteobacteria bacterium]|nr:UDP-3-O-acyl-N-acetylglucosamine deacetylase [Alphaproteobacteria bacterium]